MIKKFVFFLVSISFLIACGSNKIKLEDQPLVAFNDAYYSKWSSGIKGGGAGFNIHLSLKDKLEPNAELSGIYFKEKYASIKFNEPTIFTAFIRTKKSVETNLDQKTVKEIAKEEVDFPFSLDENEAVLVYLIKEKKKYFKIQLEKRDMGIPR